MSLTFLCYHEGLRTAGVIKIHTTRWILYIRNTPSWNVLQMSAHYLFLDLSSSLLWAFTFKRCFPYFHGKFSWKTPQRDVKTFHRCHCSSFLWLTCFSALLHSVVLLCQMLLGGVYFWCSNNLNISSILNTLPKGLALLFNLCNISDLKKRRDSEYTVFYLDISPKHAHSIKSLPLWVQ